MAGVHCLQVVTGMAIGESFVALVCQLRSKQTPGHLRFGASRKLNPFQATIPEIF
jgi:hypothetical protein